MQAFTLSRTLLVVAFVEFATTLLGQAPVESGSEEYCASMMKSYAFRHLGATSDTLVIDVREVKGRYFGFSTSGHTVGTLSKVFLWWPSQPAELQNREILDKAVFPILRSSNYGMAYGDEMSSRILFQGYLRLTGRENYKDKRTNDYRRRWQSIGDTKEDPIPSWILLQGVSFQNLRINQRIIEQLEHLYPTSASPIGLYLEYYDNPSIWD